MSQFSDVIGLETQEVDVDNISLDLLTPLAFEVEVAQEQQQVDELDDGMDDMVDSAFNAFFGEVRQRQDAEQQVAATEEKKKINIISDVVIKPAVAAATPSNLKRLLTLPRSEVTTNKRKYYKAKKESAPAPEQPTTSFTRPLSPIIGGRKRSGRKNLKMVSGMPSGSGQVYSPISSTSSSPVSTPTPQPPPPSSSPPPPPPSPAASSSQPPAPATPVGFTQSAQVLPENVRDSMRSVFKFRHDVRKNIVQKDNDIRECERRMAELQRELDNYRRERTLLQKQLDFFSDMCGNCKDL